MYGLTRGAVTLLCAGIAGFLVWLATRISDSSNGGYWAVYGIIAGAGLIMALSQVFGGWTKGGWPRMSVNVFLLAFIPVLIAAGWVIVATQPDANWFRDHIRSWSSDIGIQGLVAALGQYVAVLGFGIGLVFGYTFDTSGPAAEPRQRRLGRGRRRVVAPAERPEPPAEDRPTAREEQAAAEQDASARDRETVRTD
ncbi:MAG TPA: hypothetical protein VLD16_08120 [Gaiellaceae bacterium]|nr:hypothetical protein [Gaiellaceae bacterium]